MAKRKPYRLVMNNNEDYNNEERCTILLTESELNIFKWLSQLELLTTFDYWELTEEERLNPATMKFDW